MKEGHPTCLRHVGIYFTSISSASHPQTGSDAKHVVRMPMRLMLHIFTFTFPVSFICPQVPVELVATLSVKRH